ncbi:MAG TPA: protein kinase [Bacteroidota bacterium]|nr:protein kinase [Bacteroidota bacterium]
MIGETISNYKILEKLGEGGMGVVYKAEDTKLKRPVALKFLPAHLAASDADKARFIQEAQSASALNHPNVCTIHDIQEHDRPDGSKQMFIVMEFVQGQTLRDLMGGKRGADTGSGTRTLLPLNRATEIGIQIAEGLAAAHEKGIVHRDIKPENIMVRKDGIAQIMDFGLAKLRSSQGTRLTQQGSTVGTAGYMSPEQIQGTDADHRSDVFSLGVVLYELLTGELPFKGVHETALLYEIVNVDPPPMTTVNPELNPELDRIVFECLQKEPDERFQSVKDISKELKRYKRESSRQRATRTMATRQFQRAPGTDSTTQGAAEVQSASGRDGGAQLESSAGAGRSWKRFLWPGVSLVLLIAIVYLAFNRQGGQSGGEIPVMRFPVTLSVSSPLVLGAATLAIAPDGKNFVYLAGDAANPQLFLRPMDKLTATPMASTETASDPFFSSDGKWVGFFAAGKLKKVSIFGGASQDICEVPGFMRGGCWGTDDAIFFGHLNRGVFRVAADGGTPVEVTTLDTARGEISHRFPQSIPGGKWVIYTVKFNNIATFDDAVITAENIETHERRELIRGGSYARYLSSGHLMYARGNSLVAVPFDVGNLSVTGSPLPVVDGGMLNPFSGTANFEISNNGILIYTPLGPAGTNNVAVSWMDRQGKLSTIIRENRPFDNPRISPDGNKIALTLRAANDDIWVYDIQRAALSRLTFGGGNSDLATWTPDGKTVIFGSERGRGVGLFRRSWDGSGGTADLGVDHPPSALTVPAITPDGTRLVYGSDGDILVMETAGGKPSTPVLHSPAFEDGPQLSPDGRILAYWSNESGKNEIYAVPFPGLGGKWQISTGGSSSPPIWSRQGKELFYTGQGKLMKVDVSYEPAVHFSAPRPVCDLPTSIFLVYDISPDGRQFLIGLSESSKVLATEVNVVVGWFGELKQKFLSAK